MRPPDPHFNHCPPTPSKGTFEEHPLKLENHCWRGRLFFFFLFFFGCPCGNARSLTLCAGLGIEPTFQRFQDAADPFTPQWELQEGEGFLLQLWKCCVTLYDFPVLSAPLFFLNTKEYE